MTEPDFKKWTRSLLYISHIQGSSTNAIEMIEQELQQIYNQGLAKGKLDAIEILEDLQRNVQTKIEK